MHKNHSFIKSLRCAYNGFHNAMILERNLRTHIVVADLICFFAFYFGLTSIEWAILFIAIGIVVICELLNSSLESAVDTATHEYRDEAKNAKDFGAAGTLSAAILSIIIGITLFADIENIKNALIRIFTTPSALATLAVLIILNLYILIFVKKNKLR